MKVTMTKTMMLMTAAAISLGFVASEAQAKRGPDGPRASFETLDSDSNGQITQAELDAHRAASFATRDTNSDGKLSKDELTAAADNERRAKRADRMIERLDADNDGAISLEEMAQVKPRRGGMMRMDADGDGAITKAEFDAGKAKMGERRKNRDAQ